MRSTCGVWAPGRPPQTRKQRKTAKNTECFWRQNDRYSSKFKLLNSKFEFQAFWCIPNLNYYIYEASAEYGRRGGLHRRENSEKRQKQCENSVFGAKTSRYSSKFTFLNSKFEFQACWCITNLTHYICGAPVEYGHLGGLHRRENSEKQCKTVFLAPKRAVTAQNSKF